MEIGRKKWVVKKQTRRAAAQREGSTTERRRSSSTQTSYDYRARRSSAQTSYEYRARGGAHEEEQEEEEEGGGEDHEEEAQEQQHRQQRGNGPKPSLPNVAVHFARLVNSILKRLEEEGTRDNVYDEFMKNCRERIIRGLMSTYNALDHFYANPSKMMPSCLSKFPPAEKFFTGTMDMRLSGKELQIQQDLRAFVEELGFVCLLVHYIDYDLTPFFSVVVRLDVATVPTTEAKTSVGNMLPALESVSQ